ncbi:hypothetical protein HanRHA438_Chr11g0503881 [Helianthus annuus]|nr:hypothetical protein HanIR_Chr11g0528801 [Helianthus annuus]KAJ0870747.1 hypothetical protein HanRHA438_Chr11g0503881 [Helianthus annuus]
MVTAVAGSGRTGSGGGGSRPSKAQKADVVVARENTTWRQASTWWCEACWTAIACCWVISRLTICRLRS